MSWFMRRPRPRNEPVTVPHRSSPMTREALEESKKLSPNRKKDKK